MRDRPNKHFLAKQEKVTIRQAGSAKQIAKAKSADTEKQDARPNGQFKTTPTTSGLGATARK
jgi:hypothetical protein